MGPSDKSVVSVYRQKILLRLCRALTPPQINVDPEKWCGWKMTFLLGPGLFSGANCKFRGGYTVSR